MIDKLLIEKYYSNTCTREESDLVLEWFATPEGHEYLFDQMDEHILSLMKNDESENNVITNQPHINITKPVKRIALAVAALAAIIAVVLFLKQPKLFLFNTRSEFTEIYVPRGEKS